MSDKPETIQDRNDEIIAERGPGLYFDLGTYAAAKDTGLGMVLLGGLGGFGNGRMWAKAKREYAGWDEALEDGTIRDDFGHTSTSYHQWLADRGLA